MATRWPPTRDPARPRDPQRLFRRNMLAAIVLGLFVVTLLIFGAQNSLTGFIWVAPFLVSPPMSTARCWSR